MFSSDRLEHEDVLEEQSQRVEKGAESDVPTFGAGWSTIEKHLKKHDESMVKDFDDDINTLLVFAGLFSAVLTAFVIDSYKWLRQDDQQTTAQLLGQLVSLQAGTNTTVIPTPQSKFHPAVTSRWINCLWFLSLILSLSSALFAMITKKWLREYMHWTAMSSMPEDLVRLRQSRFDAFIKWGVPVIISTIPAMLEFALIMFFSGIIILLWTLDKVVAGLCTAAFSSVVLLVIVASILPAFFLKCPYKSPTGWAFLRVGWFLARIWNRLARAMRPRAGLGLDLILKAHQCADWRGRDLVVQARWTGIGSFSPDVPETEKNGRARLEDEEKQLLEEAQLQQGEQSDRERLARNKRLETEAAAVYPLTRSLMWIRETSQDKELLNVVEGCWRGRMMHCGDALLILTINFHVACRILGLDAAVTRSYIEKYSPALLGEGTESAAVPLVLIGDVWNSEVWNTAVLSKQEKRVHKRIRRDLTPGTEAQVADFLALDLVQVLATFPILPSVDTEVTQAILKLCAFGMLVMVGSMSRIESTGHACIQRFTQLFRLLCMHSVISEAFPGLRMSLFQCLRACEKKHSLAPSDRALVHAEHALLVLPPQTRLQRRIDRDLFASLAVSAMKDWPNAKGSRRHDTHLVALMNRMTICAKDTLAHEWRSYGPADPMSHWTPHIFHLFHPGGRGYVPEMDGCFPHDLVHHLSRCKAARLIEDDLACLQSLSIRSNMLRNPRETSLSLSVRSTSQPLSTQPSAPSVGSAKIDHNDADHALGHSSIASFGYLRAAGRSETSFVREDIHGSRVSIDATSASILAGATPVQPHTLRRRGPHVGMMDITDQRSDSLSAGTDKIWPNALDDSHERRGSHLRVSPCRSPYLPVSPMPMSISGGPVRTGQRDATRGALIDGGSLSGDHTSTSAQNGFVESLLVDVSDGTRPPSSAKTVSEGDGSTPDPQPPLSFSSTTQTSPILYDSQ